jgi:plastocyanin
MKRWFVLLVLVGLLLLTAGCTEEAAPEQPVTPTHAPTVKPTTAAPTHPPTVATPVPTTLVVSETSVSIYKYEFTPAKLTIKVGSQVRWVNNDDYPHRVSFANGDFTAFLLGPSQSSSQQFNRVGVYEYTCAMYPSMHGTITVVG